ncbi:MAG: cytidylate kinase-like family protein [Treponema sp.]|nr:cytidylate kinase-like family protein [Treponema sp.]
MGKQFIISIGRQYGSGGREIGEKLAKRLDVPLYDRNLFEEIGRIKGIDTNDLEKYDEAPKKHFFSRTVKGYSNSPEENVAELQFALLKSKWADGDSFIVLGRCADDLFRGTEGFVSIFILADTADRINRIENIRHMDEKKAKQAIERHDKKRKAYHDYFSIGGKWGDANNYDLCINSSRLGIDATADAIYDFIVKNLK